MLSINNTARNRLVAVTDAEMRCQTRDVIEVAKDYLFRYLRGKIPSIPTDLFNRDSYDDDTGSFAAERISQPSMNVWSVRLNEPDSTVAQRVWLLELTIAQTQERVIFGSRLVCSSGRFEFSFDPAVPRVYRDLATENILYGDGVRLSATPHDVANDTDVEWLLALINSPKRWRNVVVIAADEHGQTFLNANLLSSRLCGTAHVAKISPRAAFKLSGALSRHLSVFDRGARVYRPTNAILEDDIFRHPLYTFRQMSRIGPNALQNSIIHDSFRSSVDRNIREQAIPTFVQIRSANATLRVTQVANQSSEQQRKLELNAALIARQAAEAQSKEALDLAIQEEQSRREAEAERDQERGRAAAMSARIRSLEQRLIDESNKAQTLPANYDEIADWVEAEFAGRIQLAPRAIQGLKVGEYDDISLVCELLRLLATHYVDSKRSVANSWDTFQEELKGSGVELSRSIAESRAGEEGDEYFVRYRGQRVFLEWHLRKGASRDPRRSLRVYFFWDEADEEVVIGYLPGHLDNRLT